jgi:hypothetical protein
MLPVCRALVPDVPAVCGVTLPPLEHAASTSEMHKADVDRTDAAELRYTLFIGRPSTGRTLTQPALRQDGSPRSSRTERYVFEVLYERALAGGRP